MCTVAEIQEHLEAVAMATTHLLMVKLELRRYRAQRLEVLHMGSLMLIVVKIRMNTPTHMLALALLASDRTARWLWKELLPALAQGPALPTQGLWIWNDPRNRLG